VPRRAAGGSGSEEVLPEDPGKSGIWEGSMNKTTLGAALVELALVELALVELALVELALVELALVELALVELALAYGEREGVVGPVTDLGLTAEHAVLSFCSLSTATIPSASSLRSTGRHPGPPSTSSRPTTRWSSRVLRTLTDVHHRRPNHQDTLLSQRMVPRVLHLWVRPHCRLHLH